MKKTFANMSNLPDPSRRRYSDRPFPPYRFIAGETPHPTEDPQGHSYQREEKAVENEALHPDAWRKNDQYLYGVDLYNYAYWWESHEAFESLWKQLQRDSSQAHFLQGLIKISGAFLKWHARSQRGLEILYRDGLQHLHRVCHDYEFFMGVELMGHITSVSHHFRVVIAEEDSWPDPLKNYPFIKLTM